MKQKFYDNKKLLLELIPLLLVLCTFIIAWYVYPILPNKIPSHWNAAGQVDSYSQKASIFVLPIIFLVVLILLFVLPILEVFRDNMLKIYTYYYWFKILFGVFFTVLFISTILPNFGYNINVAKIVMLMIGILFTGLGIILPKLKRNFIFGIRTGWTLSNDKVWEKTHKVGGILFLILGIITIIISYLLALEVLFYIFITLTILISVFLVFYSYYLYRNIVKR
jgi:uncharacterized membrane protein